MSPTIQLHNQKPASIWDAGGKRYEAISRGIADSIEHCVLRLRPAAWRANPRLGDGHGLDLTHRREAGRPGDWR